MAVTAWPGRSVGRREDFQEIGVTGGVARLFEDGAGEFEGGGIFGGKVLKSANQDEGDFPGLEFLLAEANGPDERGIDLDIADFAMVEGAEAGPKPFALETFGPALLGEVLGEVTGSLPVDGLDVDAAKAAMPGSGPDDFDAHVAIEEGVNMEAVSFVQLVNAQAPDGLFKITIQPKDQAAPALGGLLQGGDIGKG